MARNFDETLLGMMEELLDLGNVGSPEELEDFSIDVLKVYCKIKEIDDSGSDRSVRSRVWETIEEEFELGSEDESEDESVVESEEDEPEPEPEPEIVPVIEKKVKKVKKEKE